ncbi:hypothetical protein Tco_1388377 [Tanacetum coccineum]
MGWDVGEKDDGKWMNELMKLVTTLEVTDTFRVSNKGEQSISSATIARLEAKLLSIRGGSSVIDSVTVHGLMSENEKLKKDIASPQELS